VFQELNFMLADLSVSLDTGATLALLIFALILVVLTVKSVPQGEEWTVERFGRYTRTLTPGMNFVIPVMDRVGKKLNMMETVLDIDGQEVITRDNVQVQADAIAFFQIIDAAAAAYEVRDLFRALNNLAQTNIRTVIGAMDLDDVLSNRDLINVKLLGVIDEVATPWGVKVTRVEIKDLSPPKDIIASMARQMKAERDKRAEILTAEGRKQGAILEAEGLREAQIREAEGRREAAFLDAEARERSAEAEAKATAMVSRAIAEGDIQAINYFVAQKYTEALQGIASSPSSKVIMMPLEASSIIGSVAGIAEIAREAVAMRTGGGGASRPAPKPKLAPKPVDEPQPSGPWDDA
jgi:regulator of protease activity HflC (stomatin/prohibitin superfamily)